MKRGTVIVIGLILFFVFVGNGESFEDPKHKNYKDYKEGELLIKTPKSLSRGIVAQDLELRGARTLRNFSSRVSLIKLPEDKEIGEAIEELAAEGILAEPNYFREIYNYNSESEEVLIPNDYYFYIQWGLHNTGQVINGEEDAWEITSSNNCKSPSKNGKVIVAVIGTGIAPNHPDLTENIWINPDEIADGRDNDGNGLVDDLIGWDFLHGRNNPADGNGHDTCTSSIIAGKGNDYQGMAGISWNAKIMALKIFDSIGRGTIADELEAISYATRKGAFVINMSFGGPQYSKIEKDLIENSPALFVCAAGNYGEDSDEKPNFPASYKLPNIISVAATDAADKLADFSNFGEKNVDVAAPGVKIVGALPKRKTIFHEGFEKGIGAWTTGGQKDTWGTTKTQQVKGFSSLTESPGGNYKNNTASWIMTPMINLSSCNGSKLNFYIGGIAEEKDYLYVQASKNAKNWTDEIIYLSGNFFSGITGSSGRLWFPASVDLEKYDGEKIYMRFYFKTDSSGVEDGYYIDEFTVTAIDESPCKGDWTFFNGTSMSAPFVSGIAALIKEESPLLSSEAIREIIKAGVDKKVSLHRKVATGGRVNLHNSLRLLCGDGDLAPRGNRDGQITVGDALVALRIALDLEEPSANEICRGDTAPLGNPDGQITTGDALVILRKALGLVNLE